MPQASVLGTASCNCRVNGWKAEMLQGISVLLWTTTTAADSSFPGGLAASSCSHVYATAGALVLSGAGPRHLRVGSNYRRAGVPDLWTIPLSYAS